MTDRLGFAHFRGQEASGKRDGFWIKSRVQRKLAVYDAIVLVESHRIKRTSSSESSGQSFAVTRKTEASDISHQWASAKVGAAKKYFDDCLVVLAGQAITRAARTFFSLSVAAFKLQLSNRMLVFFSEPHEVNSNLSRLR